MLNWLPAEASDLHLQRPSRHQHVVTHHPAAAGDAVSKLLLHMLSLLTLHFFLAFLQRPVIFTCSDPAGINMSSHINLLQLKMQHPSTEALLEQLVLVSVCEGICVSPTWLEHIITMSQKDLRYHYGLSRGHRVHMEHSVPLSLFIPMLLEEHLGSVGGFGGEPEDGMCKGHCRGRARMTWGMQGLVADGGGALREGLCADMRQGTWSSRLQV